MITQIVHLSSPAVFKKFSAKYKIFRDVYQRGLLGLEIKHVSDTLAGEIHKVVLKENEICYKYLAEKNEKFNLFITGSIIKFKEISKRILAKGNEDLGYKIAHAIKNYEEYENRNYIIGGKLFSFDKSYVMGIVNVTPDSFSDGGVNYGSGKAVITAVKMIDDGADIIDIGGESTRPGSAPVSEEEEIQRVIPVIKDILKQKPAALISVDTTKSKVAAEALKAGVKIVNDISAGTFDPAILEETKKYDASLILMHIKGTPEDMQDNPVYDDVVSETYDFLYERAKAALKLGIKNIFVDPGIGFGKLAEHNFEIIKRIADYRSLGFPLVIGASRKSFLGKSLNLDVTDRDEATAMINSVAIQNGARIIRTHNVKLGVQTRNLLNNLSN